MKRLAVLAGSFNPPTVAHIHLVSAARFHADEVICVVPRSFPHKQYFGATIEQRVQMLEACVSSPTARVSTTTGGLFIDIARELRARTSERLEIAFICGSDAAQRILTWDYGEQGAVEKMLQEFDLLVAARGSAYVPTETLRAHVHPLSIGEGFHDVSSTEVRERIARGQPWEHLVPPPIIEQVRSIYS